MVKVRYWLVDDIDVIHKEAIRLYDLEKEGRAITEELKKRMHE